MMNTTVSLNSRTFEQNRKVFIARLTPADSASAAHIIAVITLEPLVVITWPALVAVLV